MLFKKEFLQELDYENEKSVIEETIIGTSRWLIHYRRVFKYNDKFYETHFSRGATEMQDHSPYEYENAEIECKEVFPVEKTVIVYE